MLWFRSHFNSITYLSSLWSFVPKKTESANEETPQHAKLILASLSGSFGLQHNDVTSSAEVTSHVIILLFPTLAGSSGHISMSTSAKVPATCSVCATWRFYWIGRLLPGLTCGTAHASVHRRSGRLLWGWATASVASLWARENQNSTSGNTFSPSKQNPRTSDSY